jgi:CO/xanthine dehydrogenase FAD-binding subunit
VKPPAFEYYRAASVEDALEALAHGDEDVKVIAGGQSLIPLLNLRLARPSLLVYINEAGLDEITLEGDTITIGAMVRQETIEHDVAIAREAALLARAAGLIGHPAIRNRGTIGGSIAHADSSAEFCSASVALDATVEIGSLQGTRLVPVADLLRGPFMTVLNPDELILSVKVPRRPDHGAAYEEVAMRAGDFAFAGAAAIAHRDGDGHVDDASLVLSGVADVPLRVPTDTLVGARPSLERIDDVASLAMAVARPVDDVHASADYRRALAGTMARNALTSAIGV